jgi:hypothetical protein
VTATRFWPKPCPPLCVGECAAHHHLIFPHAPLPCIILHHHFTWHTRNQVTTTWFWIPMFGPKPTTLACTIKRAPKPLPPLHPPNPTNSHYHPCCPQPPFSFVCTKPATHILFYFLLQFLVTVLFPQAPTWPPSRL